MQGKRGLREDDLRLTRLLDKFGKLWVIHGVNLTRTVNNGCVGQRLGNGLENRAVGPAVEGGRQDGRGLKVLGEADQEHEIVVELIRLKVTDERQETGLSSIS